jgi:hypothetical protein
MEASGRRSALSLCSSAAIAVYSSTIATGFATALKLPPWLGNAIGREMLAAKPDPEKVAADMKAAGIDYSATLAKATAMLARANSPYKATELSAQALAQLGNWADRLEQHRKGKV